MCLGVPAVIVSIEPEDDLKMGKVDFGGVARKVCLEHVPEAVPGDHVLVHVGFALTRLDPDEAERLLALLAELAALDERLLDPLASESATSDDVGVPGAGSEASPGEAGR